MVHGYSVTLENLCGFMSVERNISDHFRSRHHCFVFLKSYIFHFNARPELHGRNARKKHGNMRDTQEHSSETRNDHMRVVRCQKDKGKKNI